MTIDSPQSRVCVFFVVQRAVVPQKIRTAGLTVLCILLRVAPHLLHVLIHIFPSLLFCYGPVLVHKGTDDFIVPDNVHLGITA